MSWKTVLYDFMNARNEAEGGSGRLPAMSFVLDHGFMEAETARMQRRRRVQQERRLHPIRHESRLKLSQVEETGTQTAVHLETLKTFEYEIKGVPHREERVDRERLILIRNGSTGGWFIQSVSPYIGENDSTRPINPFIQPQDNSVSGHSFSSNTWNTSSEAYPWEGPSVPLMNSQVFAQGRDPAARAVYDREAVREYAETWWNSYNPRFMQFEVDCTNYVSQCIFAGHAPMHYTGKRESGWWYRGKSGSQELWSFSWAVAQSLQNFMLSSRSGTRGEEVSSPAQLEIGDMISYSWDGSRFTHSTIVTGIAADGMPLVNAHTINSRARYWDYQDSYAWSNRVLYKFIHIPDYL